MKFAIFKVPFLVTRLNIRVIPTIAIVKDQQTVDYIRGFDDLGGIDDFKTEVCCTDRLRRSLLRIAQYPCDIQVLESRLARSGVVKVDKIKIEAPKTQKIIRSCDVARERDDDW